jgi:exopolysaccharide production protein ExoQ
VRSFFEVDVITPYVVGSFLLYYAAGLLARGPATAHRPAPGTA